MPTETAPRSSEAAGLPATPELLEVARRVCWWKAPDETLAFPAIFMAQVMTTGTWRDVGTVRVHLGDRWFREALTRPPPGLFDAASWHYWHRVLGIAPIPPLPQRWLP